jgi:hypothetical protein
MPITPYLSGQQFDPETKRILGLAFELTCAALRIGECDDGVKQAIADKIINLAKGGGRNPEVICEQALKQAGSVGRLCWQPRPCSATPY